VDTGIGDLVILDQFGGLVPLHLILLPDRISLIAQHPSPSGPVVWHLELELKVL
jgi:hypothetical protein